MNDKLKIAIGTDAFPPTTDGISSVAENYAKVLNKKDCDAIVITPQNPNRQDDKYDFEVFRYKSWYIPSKERYSIGWPFNDKWSDALISKNFNLLHSHCPLATSYYFRLVNRKKRIPTILTYHTKYEYDIEKRVPTKRIKEFAKHFILNNINAADEVWVTSLGSKESLEILGYTGDVILMPNGCDMVQKELNDDEIRLLKFKYNVPLDTPLLIYTGRMIWYKNIKTILDSCRELKSTGTDFRLILLGFGADESQIKRYYKKIGIADKIVWVGKSLDRDEIQDYFALSDLLLFPSVFDTNGLVVREAASVATPSLLIKDSCAAEGIEDNHTGFLCCDNQESITHKIAEIIKNKVLLKSVGKNAQKKIYLSWDDAVNYAYERYRIVIEKFYESGKDKEKFTL